MPYLRQAVCEPDKQHSWLYFHDVHITDLLYYCFAQNDVETYKKILYRVYPEFTNELTKLNTFEGLKKKFQENKLCGVRIIVHLTGITKIIVNNDFARQLVENEFFENALIANIKIVKLFLPIFAINNISYKKTCLDNKTFLIGSFGIPDDKLKATKSIIEAVATLNTKYNINSKCILAGYRVSKYYRLLSRDLRKFVVPFSDTSESELFAIMKSVHLAVQLRDTTHGESSGMIHQLIGMNKKIIVTEGFVDPELEKSCSIVPKFVSKEVLSTAIIKELQTNNETDNSVFLDKFSFQNLSNKILLLCGYNTAT
jgi:hypothetical protein